MTTLALAAPEIFSLKERVRPVPALDSGSWIGLKPMEPSWGDPGRAPREPGRRYRIALYSHDTMGLGHMRRNLLLAKALSGSSLEPAVLMLAGAREAGAFKFPAGVDCITLPSYYKESGGSYTTRHLDVGVKQLASLRSQVIFAALDSFEPDLLIVDNVPRGALQELDPALRMLKAAGRTRIVLGLRDVRDTPSVVREEWLREGNEMAVQQFYDEVWVYGDPNVYDLIRECGYSRHVAAKARYTGYLDQRQRLAGANRAQARSNECQDLPEGRMVLCMLGGGQDGAEVAQAFASAKLPEDSFGVLVTGPYLPEAAKQVVRERAAANPRLKVLDFVAEPTGLLARADRVITMGGYNSVCEVLSFEKRALIVPRVKPRLEQWVRAEKLQQRGLADVLHPDRLSPEAISDWLAQDLPAPQVHGHIQMNGLVRVPEMARELLQGPVPALACVN